MVTYSNDALIPLPYFPMSLVWGGGIIRVFVSESHQNRHFGLAKWLLLLSLLMVTIQLKSGEL